MEFLESKKLNLLRNYEQCKISEQSNKAVRIVSQEYYFDSDVETA